MLSLRTLTRSLLLLVLLAVCLQLSTAQKEGSPEDGDDTSDLEKPGETQEPGDTQDRKGRRQARQDRREQKQQAKQERQEDKKENRQARQEKRQDRQERREDRNDNRQARQEKRQERQSKRKENRQARQEKRRENRQDRQEKRQERQGNRLQKGFLMRKACLIVNDTEPEPLINKTCGCGDDAGAVKCELGPLSLTDKENNTLQVTFCAVENNWTSPRPWRGVLKAACAFYNATSKTNTTGRKCPGSSSCGASDGSSMEIKVNDTDMTAYFCDVNLNPMVKPDGAKRARKCPETDSDGDEAGNDEAGTMGNETVEDAVDVENGDGFEETRDEESEGDDFDVENIDDEDDDTDDNDESCVSLSRKKMSSGGRPEPVTKCGKRRGKSGRKRGRGGRQGGKVDKVEKVDKEESEDAKVDKMDEKVGSETKMDS